MNRVDVITYSFPNTTEQSQEFFRFLSLILQALPNNEASDHKVVLSATNPPASLPATTFTQQDVAFPTVHIGSSAPLRLGKFTINGDSVKLSYATRSVPGIPLLTIAELYKRLQGHLVRIDHTGINIPTVLASQSQWNTFIHHVATDFNLYRYPTGEPWFFILPTTDEEAKTEITNFPAGREPKCELVYDEHTDTPAVQIDIETDLTRQEVELLFPDPYGISFPGLADYFRAVYIQHEWLDSLDIRFDIRFKSDKPGTWETGEWLVKDGGRIH